MRPNTSQAGKPAWVEETGSSVLSSPDTYTYLQISPQIVSNSGGGCWNKAQKLWLEAGPMDNNFKV